MKKLLSEILFPSDIKCIFCDDELDEDSYYGNCRRCSLSWNTSFCLRCGRAMRNDADYCLECQNYTVNFDSARAPFVYESAVKRAVHRLKYGNCRYLAEYFARYMAQTYAESGFNCDVIVFVPMAKKRERQRGYNQARLIAEELSKLIGLPIADVLRRNRYTENLARMTRTEREKAVAGTMDYAGEPIVGKVLLVDDVLTTGFTASECSKLLKKNGAERVDVLTFATGRALVKLY